MNDFSEVTDEQLWNDLEHEFRIDKLLKTLLAVPPPAPDEEPDPGEDDDVE